MPTGSEAFLELPIALGYGPATGPTLKTALCHIRTLVGRKINTARTRPFGRAVWHSCRMGAQNQEQTRGRIGLQLRLGNLRLGELHFCPLCTALDQASSLSRKLVYVPGLTFGFVKLLASSGSHCDRTHLKNGLVPYSYVGRTLDKYSAHPAFSFLRGPGTCSGLRSGAWPWKRNNGRH